jgi:glycosyltransferase involved in cell wall biosynthesis
MKILFVSSGNLPGGISPIVLNQGKSLEKAGLMVEYYAIIGKGLKGYFWNIKRLKSHLSRNTYDLVHAHYWLSGIVASLAGARPLVVSLMGTESRTGTLSRVIIRFFSRNIWDHTIVKAARTSMELDLPEVTILPNGIDLDKFKPILKSEAREVTGMGNGRYILFVSDPSRGEKNYPLAEEAVRRAGIEKSCLLPVHDKPHDLISYYMHAGDVLLLTSLWEGSPNIIKEAMACGLPIVATDVGDIRNITSDTDGCFITSLDPDDAADKLKKAILFGKRTNGRDKIKHLDEKIIAEKLKNIYSSLIYA